jgi:hypothetical protein
MAMRRILGVMAAAFMLGTFAWPVDRPLPQRPPLTQMRADPVPLDEHDPGRRRLGALTFLEGWQLSSRDVRFGGISAMHVDGGMVTALSDSGSIVRFSVPRRAGAMPLRIDRMPRGPRTGQRKSDRDAEALAVAGESAWVAYERWNAVWRYRLPDWRFESAAAPASLRELPFTRGPEAMARLADGRFLIFAEGPDEGDGTTPLLLFLGDPALAATRALRLRYRPPPAYRPTDAALLPDGRLLVLNRSFGVFTWWRAVLTIADPRRLRPGAVLEGREIASFDGSVTGDNMEALSVTREGPRTIVWIASDDNFNPLMQRTLLLKFVLGR